MTDDSYRFHLNVTARCNLRCVHCYASAETRGPQPALDVIDDILTRLRAFARSHAQFDRSILTLGGGEPTVRKDLEQLVHRARRKRFRLRMVTNATLIDRERARALRRAGLEVAQVSLDGACRETHDAIRGRGSWDATLRGIQALKEARILTVLSYVLLPGLNLERAPQLLDLTRELGVAGAKFARAVREGRAESRGLEPRATTGRPTSASSSTRERSVTGASCCSSTRSRTSSRRRPRAATASNGV